jgi:DNA (cytosine-5)-methyltransferase 1
MRKLRVLDLFSGIGGFSLGLERTGGFETVAFCEIEPFCRRVLAKHWPNVRQYEDVRTLTADTLARDGIAVDVICGGFPCQDISLAGNGAGLEGERSGLWSEYARLIGELRPQFVIVENVAALLGRGLDRVLGDLATLGFDAEWHCIPASAVGAPHRRDRLWIVANPQRQRPAIGTPGRDRESPVRLKSWSGRDGNDDVADADQINAQGLVPERHDQIIRREQVERQARLCRGAGEHQDWSSEPALGRVAHGVPDRVGQLRAYGNAVVPQIPELIGRALLDARRNAA